MSEVKSLKEIVTQLRACGFTCEAGPLENNVDFQLLEEIAGVDVEKQRAIDFYSGKHFRSVGLPTSDIPLTHPQDIRDEIIEKAKRDVGRKLKTTNFSGEEEYYLVHGDFYAYQSKSQFIVNKEKRTVVCLLRTLRFVVAKGIAKCDPSDCFNVHIGKAIALRRALGLEVPTEYLNAPQPTEVRVGDVVEFYNEINVPHIVDNYNCRLVLKPLPNIDISYAERTSHKILDDSREEVAE